MGEFPTAVLLAMSTSLKLVQLKPQDYFPMVEKREVLLLDRQICKSWNWYRHFAVRREVSLRTEPRPVREQKWRQSLIKSPGPDQMTLSLNFITEPIKSIYCLNHFELDFFFFFITSIKKHSNQFTLGALLSALKTFCLFWTHLGLENSERLFRSYYVFHITIYFILSSCLRQLYP